MGEVKHNNHAFDDLVAEMRRDHPTEMALAGEWAAGWADGVKHGAAQIDALRAENAELVKALERLKIAADNIGGEHVTDWQQLIDAADVAESALAKYRVDGKLVTSCYN